MVIDVAVTSYSCRDTFYADDDAAAMPCRFELRSLLLLANRDDGAVMLPMMMFVKRVLIGGAVRETERVEVQ